MTEPIEVPYIKEYPRMRHYRYKNPLNFHYYIPCVLDLVNPVSTSKTCLHENTKFRRLIPTLSLIQHSYP
jgi:hypothetical protein